MSSGYLSSAQFNREDYAPEEPGWKSQTWADPNHPDYDFSKVEEIEHEESRDYASRHDPHFNRSEWGGGYDPDRERFHSDI